MTAGPGACSGRDGAIYAVIVAVTIRMLQKGLARTRQAEKANAPKRASV